MNYCLILFWGVSKSCIICYCLILLVFLFVYLYLFGLNRGLKILFDLFWLPKSPHLAMPGHCIYLRYCLSGKVSVCTGKSSQLLIISGLFFFVWYKTYFPLSFTAGTFFLTLDLHSGTICFTRVGVCLSIISTDWLVDLHTDTVRTWTLSLTSNTDSSTGGLTGVGVGLVVGSTNWVEYCRTDSICAGAWNKTQILFSIWQWGIKL